MKKMMKKKQILTTALTVAVLVGTALSVLALGSYLTNFNAQYNAQYQTAGSKLDSCILCHGASGPPNNPYGADYAANGHDFASIEQLDSDGDGYTNLDEITAGTFPGDPNDFPNAPPPTDILSNPTEGTLGTEVILSGSGFEATKGKVVLGSAFARISQDGWTDTTISFTVNKALPAGPHDVTIYPRPYGANPPILLASAFTIMDPELGTMSAINGTPGSEISIDGKFFSNKKGRVYLENPSTGKIKKCKVTSWFMDPATGVSQATFIVPKISKIFPAGTYQLVVTNKVGTTAQTTSFTVGF